MVPSLAADKQRKKRISKVDEGDAMCPIAVYSLTGWRYHRIGLCGATVHAPCVNSCRWPGEIRRTRMICFVRVRVFHELCAEDGEGGGGGAVGMGDRRNERREDEGGMEGRGRKEEEEIRREVEEDIGGR